MHFNKLKAQIYQNFIYCRYLVLIFALLSKSKKELKKVRKLFNPATLACLEEIDSDSEDNAKT